MSRPQTIKTARLSFQFYSSHGRIHGGTHGAGVFRPSLNCSEPLGNFTSVFQGKVQYIERFAKFKI